MNVSAGKLSAQDDEALPLACDIANQDEDVRAIERQFDAIPADVIELWNSAPFSAHGPEGELLVAHEAEDDVDARE